MTQNPESPAHQPTPPPQYGQGFTAPELPHHDETHNPWSIQTRGKTLNLVHRVHGTLAWAGPYAYRDLSGQPQFLVGAYHGERVEEPRLVAPRHARRHLLTVVAPAVLRDFELSARLAPALAPVAGHLPQYISALQLEALLRRAVAHDPAVLAALEEATRLREVAP